MTSEKEKYLSAGKFLSDGQRSYLQGGEIDNKSTERYRIRQKTKGAIHDLGIVARNLDSRDRDNLLNTETPDPTDEMPSLEGRRLPIPEDEHTELGMWGWVGFSHEIESIIRFYYKTLREVDSGEDGFSKSNITGSLEHALERAEREYHGMPPEERFNVDATVEVETTTQVDLERAKERFANGKELRPIELKALQESGDVNIELTDR